MCCEIKLCSSVWYAGSGAARAAVSATCVQCENVNDEMHNTCRLSCRNVTAYTRLPACRLLLYMHHTAISMASYGVKHEAALRCYQREIARAFERGLAECSDVACTKEQKRPAQRASNSEKKKADIARKCELTELRHRGLRIKTYLLQHGHGVGWNWARQKPPDHHRL